MLPSSASAEQVRRRAAVSLNDVRRGLVDRHRAGVGRGSGVWPAWICLVSKPQCAVGSCHRCSCVVSPGIGDGRAGGTDSGWGRFRHRHMVGLRCSPVSLVPSNGPALAAQPGSVLNLVITRGTPPRLEGCRPASRGLTLTLMTETKRNSLPRVGATRSSAGFLAANGASAGQISDMGKMAHVFRAGHLGAHTPGSCLAPCSTRRFVTEGILMAAATLRTTQILTDRDARRVTMSAQSSRPSSIR